MRDARRGLILCGRGMRESRKSCAFCTNRAIVQCDGERCVWQLCDDHRWSAAVVSLSAHCVSTVFCLLLRLQNRSNFGTQRRVDKAWAWIVTDCAGSMRTAPHCCRSPRRTGSMHRGQAAHVTVHVWALPVMGQSQGSRCRRAARVDRTRRLRLPQRRTLLRPPPLLLRA
jgi:hypothetical protein